MTTYIILFLGFFLLFSIGSISAKLRLRKAQKAGIYPAPGQATVDDVKRLAASGQKILAIRAYREVHGVSLVEAKNAVEKLAAV